MAAAWRAFFGCAALQTKIVPMGGDTDKSQGLPSCTGRSLSGLAVRFVRPSIAEFVVVWAGELRLKGPSLFSEYWRRPDATKASFDEQVCVVC